MQSGRVAESSNKKHFRVSLFQVMTTYLSQLKLSQIKATAFNHIPAHPKPILQILEEVYVKTVQLKIYE
jgi:hypothetical protein